MKEKKSLTAEYFEQVYAANEDPWNFETSAYEAGKYAATIAALPNDIYANGLEIGCSIGVLTELLAEKCGHLLATDVSEKALQKAVERCRNNDRITFKNLRFPAELPDEKFDLIVISEVAYYLSAAEWETAVEKLYARLLPAGHIVLVHWLPEVHDYPQTGDQVHASFELLMGVKMENKFTSRAENYRIDVWGKSAAA